MYMKQVSSKEGPEQRTFDLDQTANTQTMKMTGNTQGMISYQVHVELLSFHEKCKVG